MQNQLTTTEKRAFIQMKGANLNTLWGAGIQIIIENPTVQGIRLLFKELLSQWQDNPTRMHGLLRFDLPKALKMTFFTPDELNEQLRKLSFSYRVVREIRSTDHTAAWCGRSGFFTVNNGAATVYTDSNLRRYVRLSNGQLFECTNTDLAALPTIDQANIKAYLTGLID